MTPVIAIFDIGKTNKKVLVFNNQYQIVEEKSVQFSQVTDEDGDGCEDIVELSKWVRETIDVLARANTFDLKGVNVAAYGASFVHLNDAGEVLTPLYDYLKSYPTGLADEFYKSYGGRDNFCAQTASPPLGSLNSGLQLYRLRKLQPDVFTQVHYSLHLPQYLAWLITRQAFSDMTSIGCHTGLWDFSSGNYHRWTNREGIRKKLPTIVRSDYVSQVKLNEKFVVAGAGLHDSSSALIPYLTQFKEPFILLSTGTWNISLNPFNDSPLTAEELDNDCLCYLDFRGNPVKASRLFAGPEHENQINSLADHFHVAPDYYKTIRFDRSIRDRIDKSRNRNLEVTQFETYTEGYHHAMMSLVMKQQTSTNLVIEKNPKVRRIFVDGGFSGNPVFMNLLAATFPEMEIFAASVPHATALGAALVIHQQWNISDKPPELIKLVRYLVC